MIRWFLENVWFLSNKTLSENDQKYIEDSWKDWLENELSTGLVDEERVLITDPCRIIGLLYLPKLIDDWNNEWESYNVKRFNIPSSKYGYVYFGNYSFHIVYILNIINTFLKDRTNIELKLVQHNGVTALTFKVNDKYALCISERITLDKSDDIGVTIADSEVVWRKEDDFDIIKKGEMYVEWNNWKAHIEQEWNNTTFHVYAYHKNYLFEKFEEEGDLLLI